VDGRDAKPSGLGTLKTLPAECRVRYTDEFRHGSAPLAVTVHACRAKP